MKQFIILVFAVLFLSLSSHAGWFGNDGQQAQLRQARQDNNLLTGIVCVLGIGCVVTLVAGTMIGSKTRREAQKNEK